MRHESQKRTKSGKRSHFPQTFLSWLEQKALYPAEYSNMQNSLIANTSPTLKLAIHTACDDALEDAVPISIFAKLRM